MKITNRFSTIFWVLLFLFVLGGLIMVPSVEAGQTLVTDHAKVEASAFDGSGASGDNEISEATDVSSFSNTVTAFDDLSQGRSAGAEATQATTIDFVTSGLGIIETSGAAVTNWQDGEPGDEKDPIGEATSEFTVTFDLDQPTTFALSGSIDTAADNTNESCTTVDVTSPTGATFTVADPPGCGAPGQSIDETGTLAAGRYTYSIVAHAIATNPDETGGNAQASFELILALGCTIVGTAGDDNLVGTNGDDRICGLGGDNHMDGLGGVDSIIGGPGTDIIHGGSEVDFIYGQGGADLLFGDDGDDNIFGGGGEDFIIGGIGNDTLFGGPENDDDFIIGDDFETCAHSTSGPGSNDDEIFGGGGNDNLHGCQGLDKIHGEAGDDLIIGDKENDVLLGGPGSDKLRGKKGNDTLTGDDPGAPGPRKDVLVGGGGDDTLFARDGVRDVVKGGAGNDQAETDSSDQILGVEVFLP
jgi:Ca2+-binding RTX toxin-like protein